MKNKLPRFLSSLAWLAVLSAGSLFLLKYLPPKLSRRFPLLSAGATPAPTSAAEATSPPERTGETISTAGQPLIQEAARRLDTYTAIEARVRQRVDVLGQQLSGVGRYQQWGTGRSRRLRMELKFQIGDQLASWQQVSDGRFFWQRKDLPGQTTLGRIDVRRVQEALEDPELRPPPAALRQWMALGGLAKLLAALDHYFEFDVAEPRVLHKLPVWRMTGKWKPAELERLVPEFAAYQAQDRPFPPEKMPAHMPDSVVVVLGRDLRLPLFPYRVEYRRQVSPPQVAGAIRPDAGSNPTSMELTTIEFYEVNPAPAFQVEDFAYDPGEQVVLDETEAYLKKLWANAE